MQLAINDVSKTYRKGKVQALSHFSAQLTPGVYGFLGPNGAGKSTLMNIITCNLRASSGNVRYNGTDIYKLGRDYLRILGYMPQQQGLYEDFTAQQFLWYMAALKGIPTKQAKQKIEELLELVNLRDKAGQKLGGFSGGMKQRVLIAQGLLNDPEVLILDEPTAGLDPKERVHIRNFISEIALDKIVLLATHVVSDIECIAKQLILIKKGTLLMMDSPDKVLEQMNGKVHLVHVPPEKVKPLSSRYLVSNLIGEPDGRVAMRIVGEYPEEASAEEIPPVLEDVYLSLFEEEKAVAQI
ncbi:MAG: ATP-binding cassette domain-containing protein [Clostridiales bacterium]|jgi:ABC-2 type transport system ATP-binding protein|nr:ATP-binding cassette domain-containing protein [Clostridiales bacterium]